MSVNAKIPFQPGLALGSIVRGDVIDGMVDYSEKQAEIERVEKQMRSFEAEIEKYQMKLNSLNQKLGGQSAEKKEDSQAALAVKEFDALDIALKQLYKNQLESTRKRIMDFAKEIEKVTAVGLPTFPNFSAGIVSPIDYNLSVVAMDKRSFDSISFHSQFINMEESKEEINDRMNQSSSASGVSVSVSTPWVDASASTTWSKGLMSRVGQIQSGGKASSVYVVNAMVTTRYVRYFKKIEYDLSKLKSIVGKMKEVKDDKELRRLGITRNKANELCIYILTEAVMGGSFSGIITFMKRDEAERSLKKDEKQKGIAVSAKVSGGAWFVKGEAGGQHSSQSTDASSRDSLQDSSNTNVTVEFIAQGAIPKLQRDEVVREVLKFQDKNFQKYESSGGQTSEVSAEAIQARQKALQEATYAALNSLQQTKTEQKKITLNSPSNLMQAYDEYCGDMVDDESCGIPVGFNYTVFKQEELEELVTAKERARESQVPADETSQVPADEKENNPELEDQNAATAADPSNENV